MNYFQSTNSLEFSEFELKNWNINNLNIISMLYAFFNIFKNP